MLTPENDPRSEDDDKAGSEWPSPSNSLNPLLDIFGGRILAGIWKHVSEASIEQDIEAWLDEARLKLLGDEILPEPRPIAVVRHEIAQDNDHYYLLVTLEGEESGRTYYSSEDCELIPMTDGARCAYLITVDKALTLDEESGEDEAQGSSLCPVIDEASVRREIQSFAQGDREGLLAHILYGDASESNVKLGDICDVAVGVAGQESSDCIGLHLVNRQGERFVYELDLSDDLLGLATYGPTKIQSEVVVIDTSNPKKMDDKAAKLALSRSISKFGLRPIDLGHDDYNALRNDCREELLMFFEDWSPAADWELVVDEIYSASEGNPDPVLIETSIRTPDGKYLYPSREGSQCFASTSPIKLFFQVSDVVEDGQPSDLRGYQLRLIALPPNIGMTPIVSAMVRDPQRSMLIESVEAAIASELKISDQEKSDLQVTAIIPLALEVDERRFNQDEDVELCDDMLLANSYLCFHQHGASLIRISNDLNGVIDLRRIALRHFFENLKPLQVEAEV